MRSVLLAVALILAAPALFLTSGVWLAVTFVLLFAVLAAVATAGSRGP